MTIKAQKPRKTAKKPKPHDHEYHVVWNGVRGSWDVQRDGGHTGQFAYDKDTAIGLAVREARLDARQGLDVVVCVQQKDGSFVLDGILKGLEPCPLVLTPSNWRS